MSNSSKLILQNMNLTTTKSLAHTSQKNLRLTKTREKSSPKLSLGFSKNLLPLTLKKCSKGNRQHLLFSKFKSEKEGLELTIPETFIFRKGKLKCIITTNKSGKIWVNYNIKDISYLKIRHYFKNFMKKKWNTTSQGPGVFTGLKFEDRLWKKHQIERENAIKTHKEKSNLELTNIKLS